MVGVPAAAVSAVEGTLVDILRSLLAAQCTMESLQLFSFWCVLSIFRHCTTFQHTATHCNTLQHYGITIQLVNSDVTYCNTLQHTAAHLYVMRSGIRCNTSSWDRQTFSKVSSLLNYSSAFVIYCLFLVSLMLFFSLFLSLFLALSFSLCNRHCTTNPTDWVCWVKSILSLSNALLLRFSCPFWTPDYSVTIQLTFEKCYP